jgi:hypothetical protein
MKPLVAHDGVVKKARHIWGAAVNVQKCFKMGEMGNFNLRFLRIIAIMVCYEYYQESHTNIWREGYLTIIIRERTRHL